MLGLCPLFSQLLVSWWFGLVVWDSMETPTQPSLSFSGIQSESKPPPKTTNWPSGSTIRTLLHGKINLKDWQVLSLGDVGFLQFFRVVSGDCGRPWPLVDFPQMVNYMRWSGYNERNICFAFVFYKSPCFCWFLNPALFENFPPSTMTKKDTGHQQNTHLQHVNVPGRWTKQRCEVGFQWKGW